MRAHTPGPWTYEPSDDENSGMIWAKTGFIVEFNENPSEANARLISAAPDLLDELENCMDLLNTCFSNAPVDSCIGVALIKARSAIAKATGETA